MEFTISTLSSTFKNFSLSLERRNLSLRKHAERDVWANIVLGRNYSAAASLIKANVKVRAAPIFIEKIRKTLQEKSRFVDNSTALSLFVDAIKNDLNELSDSLLMLGGLIQCKQRTCLIRAHADRYGFGIMDSEFPGYLGLGNLYKFSLSEDESAWYRSSHDIVTGVVNSIAGIEDDKTLIYMDNLKLMSKREDEEFLIFCRDRIGVICAQIAEKLLAEYPRDEMQNWDLSFDTLYNIVYGVFEDSIMENRTSWLKIDYDSANATIDHTSVRLLDTMKWLLNSDDEDRDDSELELLDTLARSARLPIEKILKI